MLPGGERDKGMGSDLMQWSPTFLAPGTGFMEDNFSTDLGGGMVLRRFKCITLSSPPAVRPSSCEAWTGTGPWTGGWGPLI